MDRTERNRNARQRNGNKRTNWTETKWEIKWKRRDPTGKRNYIQTEIKDTESKRKTPSEIEAEHKMELNKEKDGKLQRNGTSRKVDGTEKTWRNESDSEWNGRGTKQIWNEEEIEGIRNRKGIEPEERRNRNDRNLIRNIWNGTVTEKNQTRTKPKANRKQKRKEPNRKRNEMKLDIIR